MSDVEHIINYDNEFNKNLDASRKQIDLNSPVGKYLDHAVTQLYKKYGFLDHVTKQVELNADSIPEIALPPFIGNGKVPAEEAFKMLGIDMNFYNKVVKDNKQFNIPWKDVSKIADLRTKAQGALNTLRTALTVHRYTSGSRASAVFGELHWVTDFANALEKFKQEHSAEHKTAEESLVESLKGLIYHKPKKLQTNIKETAEKFNTNAQYVSEVFRKHTNTTPKEYAQLIINEGIGDYLKYQGKQAANNVIGKYGVGQSKVVAQAKQGSLANMNSVLTAWNQIVQGKKDAATPEALKNFLVGHLSMNPDVVDEVLKEFQPKFKLTSKDYLNQMKAQNTSGPKFTSNTTESIKENKLNEEYLPANLLRDFFLDAINAQRTSVLRSPKSAQQQAATPVTQTPPTSSATVKPVQPVQPTQPVQAAPTPQTQATAPTTFNPETFKAAIAKMPANQRSKAIIDVLPLLSDDEIKTILGQLITKKP